MIIVVSFSKIVLQKLKTFILSTLYVSISSFSMVTITEKEALERVDGNSVKNHFGSLVNIILYWILCGHCADDIFISRYERMILDKTQVDLELSHLHTVMEEDREDVEQALIQADVWRSKFLATRYKLNQLIQYQKLVIWLVQGRI